jgi:hypothetical protein
VHPHESSGPMQVGAPLASTQRPPSRQSASAEHADLQVCAAASHSRFRGQGAGPAHVP